MSSLIANKNGKYPDFMRQLEMQGRPDRLPVLPGLDPGIYRGESDGRMDARTMSGATIAPLFRKRILSERMLR